MNAAALVRREGRQDVVVRLLDKGRGSIGGVLDSPVEAQDRRGGGV